MSRDELARRASLHKTPESPDAPAEQGCQKDTDCKGDRICVNHECVGSESQ